MRKSDLFSRLGFVFVVCLLVGFSHNANANILITPTRVVFEDGQRFAVVTLINNGNVVKSYEMDWIYLEMVDGSGGYVRDKVVPEGMADVSRLVDFSPRRVTLAPGSKQKIRLALRRPAEIADGDYHSHLRFSVVPEDVTSGDILNNSTRKKASANISINLSYTVPVIVRIGEPKVEVSVGQISMARDDVNGKISVTVPLHREGGYSVLGHLRAYYIDESGNKELVGEIGNANLFSEISSRDFTFSLNKEISRGTFEVELRSGDSRDSVLYAQRLFPLQ